MWRVAVYAQETPGRRGRDRLDRQVARLAGPASPVGWAGGTSPPTPTNPWAPGGARASPACSLTRRGASIWSRSTATGASRPTATNATPSSPTLRAVGVATVLLRPSAAHQLVTVAAEVALIDLIDGAMG